MPILIVGLVIAALLGTVIAQAKHSGKVSSEKALFKKASEDKDKVIDQERAARAKSDQIAAEATARWEKVRKRFAGNRKDIANAPASDDGPLAPVLRRELDRLPGPPGPADSSVLPETATGSGPVPVSGGARAAAR